MNPKSKAKMSYKQGRNIKIPQVYLQPLQEVNIKPLKTLVLEKFPKDCPLRNALLAERDVLKIYEFLAKIETWLNLLRIA
jgi:hypothetical protein